MSEYRQDATTGAWVIVAPERSRRPSDWLAVGAHGSAAHGDHVCPFCPGNERLIPPILDQTPADGTPGWYTRVVANKHPVLRPEGDPAPRPATLQTRLAGFGYHEVIIESPRHDADLTTFDDAELHAFVQTWHRRFVDLARRPGVEAVFVFRNRGRAAGASLVHPHSQVIATAIAAPLVTARAQWARDRYAQTGCCATCDELEREATDGRRTVETTRRFLVTVPYAAGTPFELRITPFRHAASFAETTPEELAELGPVLRRAVSRLERAVGDPAYNLMIESAGIRDRDPASDHWSVRIVPDLVRPGGFELGSGLPINPSSPEDDAAALRAVDISDRNHPSGRLS